MKLNVPALTLMTLIVSMGFIGCASHEIRALTPQPIEAYSLRTDEAGVSIAAKAFTSKEEVENTFYLDLTEEGFVPILLVMNNESRDNIVLLKEYIELMDSAGNVLKPVSTDIMVEKFEHDKIVYALLGFGIFSYMSADEANKKMRRDWSSKELPVEKILLPNRKAHGVVYFELSRGLLTLPNATLRIRLQNMRTGKIYLATIRIAENIPVPLSKQASGP